MISTPKLATKSTKDELPSEETPKTNSKRKRASVKEKVFKLKSKEVQFVSSFGYNFVCVALDIWNTVYEIAQQNFLTLVFQDLGYELSYVLSSCRLRVI